MESLFEGFETFGAPVVPEGAITVQYGLSVDTVQLVGEATAAPEEGVNPVTLAEKLAAKFNMPTSGLRVFIDGVEVPFDRVTLLPAGARIVEFRQPGSEKGASPILLPMPESAAFTVEVVALDITETYQMYRSERQVGTIADPALMSAAGLEFRREPDLRSDWLAVYRVAETAELVGSETTARFVSRIRKTGAMTARDLLEAVEGEVVLAITINGRRAENLEHGYDAVMPGQIARVFVTGTTRWVELPAIVGPPVPADPESESDNEADLDYDSWPPRVGWWQRS